MNVYKLEAAIGLNSTEYQKGLKTAGESMSAMGDKIKAGAAAIGKVTAAGLAAGSAAVTALAKSAVSAYADYEQLVGGVEKLFGESSDLLMAYAKDAYKTAGMSVNEYMETATSFAAALTTSVQAAGGSMDEAVEYADTAMRDMSDNANTFGTDIASIQTAYQGFAKQNYTMLDNLKLGYGGTKAEMERLIEDANKLRHEQGINNDLTIESYADIITAIHEVQTQMNITGTTSREASKTISGSIGAVKAAWTNLTIEIAKDDGDIDGAFQAFGENVGAVVDNMLPRVEKAIGGVGELITAAAPQISSAIAQLIPKILPSLLKSAASLTGALGKALIKSAPELLSATSGMMKELWSSFAASDLGVFDWIKDDAIRVVDAVKGVFKNIDFNAIRDSFAKVGSALNNAFSTIGDGIAWVTENIIAPVAEWAANDVLPKVFNIIADGANILTSALNFLKEPALAVWNGFLKPLAEGAGIIISGGLDLIADSLNKISEDLEDVDWDGFWDDIANGEFFDDWAEGWKGIENWFDEHQDGIDSFFGASSFGAGWNKFWQGLGHDIYDLGDKMDKLTLKLVDFSVDFSQFIKMWTDGAQAIADAVEKIKKKYNEFKELWGVGADAIKDSSNNSIAGALWGYLRGKLPAFAEGGRVSSPTLALVGEREPETIIPDSKLNQLGNITIENININGTFDMANPEDRRKLIEEFSMELQSLSISQQRAVGGKTWQ